MFKLTDFGKKDILLMKITVFFNLINNKYDIGFARKLPSNDIVMDSLVGTPLYMSP